MCSLSSKLGSRQMQIDPSMYSVDSAKGPELLSAVAGNDNLRRRIRGTGVSPAAASVSVNNTFMVSYAVRYPGASAGGSAMGTSYDAAYAIAYAIAARPKSSPVTGANVAQGLRRLASSGGTTIEVERAKILAAFSRLTRGEPVNIVGTFSALKWNENGAIAGGTIDLWCISATANKASFDSSGLSFDLATGRTVGQYLQCAP
jgi:hypothetical protein